MYIVKTALASAPDSPYSQSLYVEPVDDEGEKIPNANLRAWEEENWWRRLHTDNEGKDPQVLVPNAAFMQSIAEAARYLNKAIPGEGTSKWTKCFESAVYVGQNIPLYRPKWKGDDLQRRKLVGHEPIRRSDAYGRWFLMSSKGNKGKGGGSRVWRKYPMIDEWVAFVDWVVLDDRINQDIFTEVLRAAGFYKGIGRFRPEVGGSNGRFYTCEFAWPKGLPKTQGETEEVKKAS